MIRRDSACRTLPRRIGRLATGRRAATFLLCVFCAAATTSARREGNTFDEPAYLTSGYCYWVYNDYHMSPGSGNLNQRCAALPLVVAGYRFPPADDPRWATDDVWGIAHAFMFTSGNDADAMLFRARLPTILLAAALGVVVYVWARALWGAAGGAIALVLYAFSPTVLAHARLATADLFVTALLLMALGSFWKLLDKLSPLWLLISCAAFGALFVTKFSAVAAVPVVLLLIVVRLVRGQPMDIAWPRIAPIRRRLWQSSIILAIGAIHLAAVVAVIWACFGFSYADPDSAVPRGAHYQLPWEDLWKSPQESCATALPEAVLSPKRGETLPASKQQHIQVRPAIEFARRHRLLPEAYLYGFSYIHKFAQARRAFLGGQYGAGGWWCFFPYCFLVKTPLPWLAMVALAALAAVVRWASQWRRSARAAAEMIWLDLYRTAPLWGLLVVYWAFALGSSLNIGQRYLLPTYPPLCILAGASAWWLSTRWRLPQVAVAGCAIGVIAVSLSTWPHYLAYFNSLAGGPKHGYRHLVDSSLDWGQDLPGLKQRLDRYDCDEGEHAPVYLAYFGTGSVEYYGIEARRLPGFFDRRAGGEPFLLGEGIYCISATQLQCVYTSYPGLWTRRNQARYDEIRPTAERFILASNDPAARQQLLRQHNAAFWKQLLHDYEQLRFKRLCTYLRRREPDDHVGYSILIYRLGEEEVRRALDGPLSTD